MNILAAIATDDGRQTIKRHFGDADFYDIYEIKKDKYKFIKRIDNSSVVEKQHADPEKARSIAGILAAESINTAVSRVFGPNLKRIKSKFVCIITESTEIEKILPAIMQNHDVVEAEWNKGSERNYLKLNDEDKIK